MGPPHKPGQPRRVDYEYKRNGVEPRGSPDTANLFMMFAPLEGWRAWFKKCHFQVTRKSIEL